jgi:phosphatidate cytidylyltransferase
MVYKNLFNRLFFSLFFFVIYFIALTNKYLLFVIGTLIYLFIYYEICKFFNKSFFKLILLYLFLSYLCFSLYFFISYDFIIFNIFVFTIILFDSFSFFTGKVFGNNYIFKKISPKKTLEGYLGGFFFTNVFQIGFFYFIYTEITIIKMLIVINLTILISIIGDLIESFFKRKNNIKDSSRYLPGHGGFFDRFDSFIASIIMLTLFSLF